MTSRQGFTRPSVNLPSCKTMLFVGLLRCQVHVGCLELPGAMLPDSCGDKCGDLCLVFRAVPQLRARSSMHDIVLVHFKPDFVIRVLPRHSMIEGSVSWLFTFPISTLLQCSYSMSEDWFFSSIMWWRSRLKRIFSQLYCSVIVQHKLTLPQSNAIQSISTSKNSLSGLSRSKFVIMLQLSVLRYRARTKKHDPLCAFQRASTPTLARCHEVVL